MTTSPPTNMRFASDNVATAAPEFLAAVAAANTDYVWSYGDDSLTASLPGIAAQAFAFDGTLGVFPTLNGKAANHLALLAITDPGGVILCHEHAHILVDEDDGPAFYTGARMVGIVDDGRGKIGPEALRDAIRQLSERPADSSLSITQTTEAGTVYSLAEIRELTGIAREAGVKIHLDGARLSNAAAPLGCDLADLTWRSGVDILSLGITKNGGLMSEAVVSFDPAISERFLQRRAKTGHIPSKLRFLSAQVAAGLEGDGWRVRATHANAMAGRLAAGFQRIPGIRIIRPVEANIVFAEMSLEVQTRLTAGNYFVFATPMYGPDVHRFVCSWSTAEKDVDELLGVVRG